MNDLYQELGDLKRAIRRCLDPATLTTPEEVREAYMQAQAVAYRAWGKNLDALARDDALGRQFFAALGLVESLYLECKRAVMPEGVEYFDEWEPARSYQATKQGESWPTRERT